MDFVAFIIGKELFLVIKEFLFYVESMSFIVSIFYFLLSVYKTMQLLDLLYIPKRNKEYFKRALKLYKVCSSTFINNLQIIYI